MLGWHLKIIPPTVTDTVPHPIVEGQSGTLYPCATEPGQHIYICMSSGTSIVIFSWVIAMVKGHQELCDLRCHMSSRTNMTLL